VSERTSDIVLDGPTLRFCIKYLRKLANSAPPSSSPRSPIRKALNLAADELLALDNMFGDQA